MNGFLITFFTETNASYNNKPIQDWIIESLAKLQITGVTIIRGQEGIDHLGKVHSANFFELADQPIQLQVVLNKAQSESLINLINKQGLKVFYVKTAVEFGTTGN
ncbi:DUF190 domain-containing protein [Acinetobacter sp. HY1485]|uniref:DUF190 domain-containing protein n=1 Tax=Acinetobacter sp. HY1485 TaxID=2970918 RepID=UPI0022B9BCFB|nr:DUF190 domain-containing protein [Acinetobacter sp. HY1485]